MSESYSNRKFAALTFLPVIAAHLCLAPFWLVQAYAEPWGGWLPVIAIVLTALVIPTYLAVLGCRVVLRRICVGLPFAGALLLASLALNVFLDYGLWGLGSGMFFTPDEMTLVLMRAAGFVGLGVLVAPLLVTFFIRSFLAPKPPRRTRASTQ
jgi:hypothetical protein